MKLPDDMFRQELLQYLIVHDIVRLDYAFMNHKYRSQLLDKIAGVILMGDNDNPISRSLFEWLSMRRVYMICMYLMESTVDGMTIDEDGFNYLQHLHLSSDVSDDSIISLLPHCKKVLSLDLVLCFNITDASITSHH